MKLHNKHLFLSLLHCLIVTSSDSKCPQSSRCRDFTLNFPLTDIRNSDCGGLFMVYGCESQHENLTIRLAAGGRRYNLLNVLAEMKAFTVRDHMLEKLLVEEDIVSVINEFLPKSPSVSLKLSSSPISTSVTCYHDCCNEVVEDSCPLSYFIRLTHEFTLDWTVSEDCQKCRRGGGQCLSDARDEFYCKKGTSSLMLILALSGGGLLLLLLCLLVFCIIRLRRKIMDSSSLHSRNISLGPSKSEIDGGSSFFGIPIFSYTELEAATNHFDPSKELGDGGFGTVYYGKLRDGREVAIKRLYEQNCRRVEQFMNEIKILTSLRHPNLVTLYGCTSRRSRELLLVYEYISNGTVADHLHGDRAEEAPLTWPVRMRIAVETAAAMAFLHKSDIIHRDVKTENILLDKYFNVKVADFGLSRLFPNDVTHISTAPGGTPGYIDPEYHQCYQVTDKSDVYSFGVVLVELISSMPAVDINRQPREINLANLAVDRIQRCVFDELIDPSLGYNFDAEVTRMTTSVAEIAFRCLQLEKEMRPSMAEVLAFLKDI
ncbi:hypothetical protein C2S52_016287 [Perilla frutescens var. hirtella]|nr:hypothetical protein C2S52_016287 [Perilla frutescens var. hirtella]